MEFETIIRFGVDGVPLAQPRARAYAKPVGGGRFAARVYDDQSAKGWKDRVAIAAGPHCPRRPLAGPVRVDADFLFPRPKYMGRAYSDDEIPHTAKPDRDNCEKALLDCLKRLGFFVDDAQVCCGEVRKFYVCKGGHPGASIRIGVPEQGGIS